MLARQHERRARTNKFATPPSKANAQPSTIVAAAHAADKVHAATAALNATVAHAATEAHAVILARVARAARLAAKEKAKASDKIPLPIVPTSLYRLTRRSYLTATLAVRCPRFRISSRRQQFIFYQGQRPSRISSCFPPRNRQRYSRMNSY